MVTVSERDLVSEVGDEAFGFSLQVHVHIVELPVEGLVDLLLPLRPTRLLHGLLNPLPVQITRQVCQEHTHMLHVVESDAQLCTRPREHNRRKRRHRWGEKG